MAKASAGNKGSRYSFERRDLTSEQKSHPSVDYFGKTIAIDFKKNVTHFSFIFFNTNGFTVPVKNLNLNY